MIRDFFRHGSNAALALVILLVLAGNIFNLWRPHPALFILGAVLFLGSEYGFHRYAFHAPPAKIPFILTLQHRLHYDHHQDPARLDLLFLPLWFILPNFALTAALASLLWPSAAAIAALLAGTSAAILYYEWVHYIAHIPYRPRTAWGAWIKKYHLRHHFKNEHFWFGVTNPAFDVLLRSYAGTRRRQNLSHHA